MFRQALVVLLMCFMCVGCSGEPKTEVPDSAEPETVEPETGMPDAAKKEQGAKPSAATEPKPVDYEANPIVMTARQWKDHKNELDYKTEHLKGRTIQITGEVSDLGINFGYYDEKKPATALDLYLPKDENTVNDVSCEFFGPPVWRSVGPGQKVTVEFKYSGDFSARPVDCKIVSVEGKPFPAVQASELAAEFAKDSAAVDKKYIHKPENSDSDFDIERKSLGIAGKVKEVNKSDSGSVTILFETGQDVTVEAEMFAHIADKVKLPAAGDEYRVWGTYQSSGNQGFGGKSLGVSDAVPFPVK
ncbi:hypothetical protein [Gimesia algae]|uniref:tRNA_anti-like protein n=1 Tax=Gimesia algae TaxID=2527971 RepID=A0A517VBB4_9PLAN|nr:hypothetical protein [Gimesia algae]QDT90295.1 tRNA_anti-like protein [Gimesia algae]